MKLLQIIASAAPVGGGPIATIRESALMLRLHGHSTDVACLDRPDAAWLAAMPCNASGLGPGILSYRYKPGFCRWIRSNAPSFDCVITHGLWNYTSVATWRALRESSIPYFVFPHGTLDPSFRRKHPAKHFKKLLYWFLIEHRVLNDARAVLFTSEEERDLAHSLFRPSRYASSVVGCCVASPSSAPGATAAAFLERFPRLRGKRLVLFLSRIHPVKGCDVLISAFARIATTDEALVLVMAGPDVVGWTVDLRALASRLGVAHRIIWAGMLFDDAKWSALRAAEVFVLPTHHENFGIAIVESLACGTPVLITDRARIWREVQQDGAGLVGSPSVEGIVKLFEKWHTMSVSEREEMRERARRCYGTRYRSEVAAKTLVEALRAHRVGDSRLARG